MNNFLNVGDISAGEITGSLVGNVTGNVYGYDIRDWAPILDGFDFGGVSTDYSSIIEFVVGNTEVDFGSFTNPTSGNVDLGSI
jgi:hypothetical protein